MSIRDLIKSRLVDYDPTLDLTDGSPVMTLVVDPLAETLGEDTLTSDAATLIRTKLAEAYPDLTLGAGDALSDILINAASVILEPYRAEIGRVERALSLRDPASLSGEDMDAIAANWLARRQYGTLARGTVSVTFSRPVRVVVSTNVSFVTASGLVFVPVDSYTLTADDVLATVNAQGAYEVPISVVANDYGAAYNVSAGAVSVAVGLPAHEFVTNKIAIRGGTDEETNTDFAQRLSDIANERSLVSDRGIRAKVKTGIFGGSITSTVVAGFGDEEMTRDALPATSHGDARGAGFAVPLGRVCAVCLYSGAPVADDVLRLTPLGSEEVTEVHVTRVVRPEGTLLPNTSLFIVEGDFTALEPIAYSAVVTTPPYAEFDGERVTSSVHLGGKSDAYILPTTDTESSFTGTPYPINGYSGTGVTFNGDNYVTLNEEPVGDGTHIYFEGGDHQGAYRIIHRENLDLYLDANFTASEAAQLPYRLIDTLELPTSHPTRVILPRPGTPPLMVQLMASRREVMVPDVTSFVEVGDLLQIPNLDIVYEITSVSGESLTIATPPTSTGAFEAIIYRDRDAMSPCIAHVNALRAGNLAVPYGPSLGAEVRSATQPELIFAGHVGRVLPHYTSMQILEERAISADVDIHSYTLTNDAPASADALGYSDGSLQPRMGDVLLSYKWVDNLQYPRGEVALPGDLFVPGPYTVVSIWGDLDVESFIDTAVTSGLAAAKERYVTSRMPQPGMLSPGDVVVVGNEELVVDRAYPVILRLDTDATRARSTENAVRVTLLRLRSHAQPPMASTYEEIFALRDDASSTGETDAEASVSALDLLRLLTSPERLVADTSAALGTVAADALSDAGLTATAVELPVSDTVRDQKIVAGWRPSEGVARVYYNDARDVLMTPLWWPLYSTEEELRYRLNGVNERVQPPPTQLGDLRVRLSPSPLMGDADPRTWRRDGSYTVLDDLPDARISAPGAADALDVFSYDSTTPSQVLLDLRRGDQLRVLPERLSFEGSPPRVTAVYLPLIEGTEISVLGLLADSAYANSLVTENRVSFDAEGRTLLNAYGQSPYGALSTLSALTTFSIDPNTDLSAVPRKFVFYVLTPRDTTFGLPLFHVIAGTGTLKAARLYEQQTHDFPLGVEGDYVFVETSSNASDVGDTVVSRTADTLTVDRVFAASTADVQVRGWARVEVDEPNVLIIEGPRVLTAEGLTEVTHEDNLCGVGTGGTTRFLTDADVGKSITLLNFVVRADGPALWPADAPTIRENPGTFSIASVESDTAVDTESNSLRTYVQRVTLSAPISSDALGYLQTASETEFDVFFHVSDTVIPDDAENLKTVVSAPAYHRDPLVYKIASLPLLTSAQTQVVYVSTLDDQTASLEPYGVYERATNNEGELNAARILRNPFSLYRESAVTGTTEQSVGDLWHVDVPYRCSTSRQVNVGEMNPVIHAGEQEGYRLEADGEAYSSRENPVLHAPPVVYSGSRRVDVTTAALTIDYTHSPTVDQISSVYAGDNDRVVCSDVLFRRALPCYLGIEMNYTGGSTADVVSADVRRLLRSSVVRGDDISSTELIALAHRRGASKVGTDTRVFAVVSDLDRRRHLFFLNGALSAMLSEHVRGTRRILGPEVPVSVKLGASLDIRRS